MATARERLEQVEELLGMLASRATGGTPNNYDYRDLRELLLDDDEIGPRLPSVVRSHRNLDDFWGYIKVKFGRYEERRQHLREQFEPLLTQLEERNRNERRIGERRPMPLPRPDESRMSSDDVTINEESEQSAPERPPVKRGIATAVLSRRVFIVHGRDSASKEAVARLLATLGLEPIILHEQPSRGRTVIEKFEANSDVDFAVVIMTPDDVGGPRGGEQRSRARQNVILELGYFLGRLGRDRVAALVGKGVEQPSDVHGLVYVPLDTRSAWHLALAKELRAAGFDIDFSRL